MFINDMILPFLCFLPLLLVLEAWQYDVVGWFILSRMVNCYLKPQDCCHG